MKSKVTETIFSGENIVMPLSIVQHVEKQYEAIYGVPEGDISNQVIGRDKNKLDGIFIITDKTKWSFEFDTWENACYISNCDKQAEKFIQCFCDYITEKDGMLEKSKN